ncbi:MAG TPA: efflux RND transporter periplasmic adaptor subunit [Phycisphaerae bacterium]|nr:efflux RND transporter periplasmic adaptor subunit [Phycisphaerae bacterium]
MARQVEHKEYRVAVGAEPADRPVPALRADLLISPQLFYGQLCFVIKDPVTLRYFRMQPVEHMLAMQMDGQRTARDLLAILQQTDPESTLGVQDVLRFVGMLHESHLLVGQGAGHADWLMKRRNAAKRRHVLELLQNFLFFKVPVFHPDRLLGILDKTIGRVVLTKTAGIAALGLILVALWNVLTHMDRFTHMSYSLLSWQNMFVLYCVFTGTKIFHEFGHGLAAKHFGGEVSSMGVMMFIVTPSFYCDTSDAWMIPSRAARLWINAGGIVVELVMAALATFVWLYTPDDGLLNQVALNVMISCSVATLFFNANPLMRYDGYYFLADLLEIPNLMTKGRQLLGCYLQKYLLGLKPTMPPDQKRRFWLISYALGSAVYRWVVVFGIIAMLYLFFDRYGMGPIGVLLATLYVVMTVVWPLVRSMQFLWKQRWDLYKRLAWMTAAGAAGVAALVLLAFMPVRNSIREPLVVLSQRDEAVFVRTPGFVEVVEKDTGERVKAGDVIVRLADPTLSNTLSDMEHRREQARIEAATAAAENKPGLIAAANEMMVQYDKEIALIRERMGDLVLRAPMDGVIVRETSLKRVTGNYVPLGLKLCRVIETGRLQAKISLPQQKAALVRAGMPVRIRLWSAPESEIHSVVGRVSSELSDQLLHPALASGNHGDVDVKQGAPTEANPEGMKSATRRSTVIIELPSGGEFLADGMTGRGEIEFPKVTAAERVWRLILDSTTPDWHL